MHLHLMWRLHSHPAPPAPHSYQHPKTFCLIPLAPPPASYHLLPRAPIPSIRQHSASFSCPSPNIPQLRLLPCPLPEEPTTFCLLLPPFPDYPTIFCTCPLPSPPGTYYLMPTSLPPLQQYPTNISSTSPPFPDHPITYSLPHRTTRSYPSSCCSLPPPSYIPKTPSFHPNFLPTFLPIPAATMPGIARALGKYTCLPSGSLVTFDAIRAAVQSPGMQFLSLHHREMRPCRIQTLDPGRKRRANVGTRAESSAWIMVRKNERRERGEIIRENGW